MSGPKIKGWRQKVRRPYLDNGVGLNPHERGQYVVVYDEDGDIVGTGENCKEAWEEANATLQRRERMR